jgi:hypothetical protein
MCWWKWVIGGALLAFFGLIIYLASFPGSEIGSFIGGICVIGGGICFLMGLDRARILINRWHNRP